MHHPEDLNTKLRHRIDMGRVIALNTKVRLTVKRHCIVDPTKSSQPAVHLHLLLSFTVAWLMLQAYEQRHHASAGMLADTVLLTQALNTCSTHLAVHGRHCRRRTNPHNHDQAAVTEGCFVKPQKAGKLRVRQT